MTRGGRSSALILEPGAPELFALLTTRAERFESSFRVWRWGFQSPGPPPTKPYVRDSRIRLPPWMFGVKSLPRIRMQNVRGWNPSVELLPGYLAALTAPQQHLSPQRLKPPPKGWH